MLRGKSYPGIQLTTARKAGDSLTFTPVPGRNHTLQIGVKLCHIETSGAVVLQRIAARQPSQKSQGQSSSAVTVILSAASNPVTRLGC
jgi:hypothetical protein